MTPPASIRDVTDTALLVAAYRAIESERPDALFRDPFAGRLAGERGMEIARRLGRSLMGGWSVALRTVIIDGFLKEAIDEGVDTILNLGAGLDARPYRMDLPETLHWIEADFPATVESKNRALAEEAPRCRLERIPVDLADAAARRALLARIGGGAHRALVLTEGVVPYLSEEEVGALAGDLRAEESIRYWIVDYFAPLVLRYRRRRSIARHWQNAPFRFDPKDWFAFFAEHGWKPKEMRYLAEETRRLKRRVPLTPLMKLRSVFFHVFASRKKREEMAKLLGYAILEPV